MSYVNFGMSFVLKGVHHPKIAKRVAKNQLLDGVFQVHIDNRQFVFFVKSVAIHSVPFSSLYDAPGNPENKFIVQMLFNGTYPIELHAQTESEREVVHRILQNIIAKTHLALEDRLQDKSVHKQATVKKKGKLLATRRIIVLNTFRHCLILFPGSEPIDQSAPKYHILLHHRVSILPRKRKSLQLTGTYKNMWVAFRSQEERDSWLSALNAARLPAPIQQTIQTEDPLFEAHVDYFPQQRQRHYIPASVASSGRAGPSPD